MKVFKVTFIKNKIDSCKELEHPPRMPSATVIERHNGLLIYALIQAKSEREALEIADGLVKELK